MVYCLLFIAIFLYILLNFLGKKTKRVSSVAYLVFFFGCIFRKGSAVNVEKRIVAEAVSALSLISDFAVALASDGKFSAVGENTANASDILCRSLVVGYIL